MPICEGCFEKQKKIDRLEEEIEKLRYKLRYEERKTKEGYFGSSTPSSKKPLKKNSVKRKNGGAVKGHSGYGRKAITEEDADNVEYIPAGTVCPECGNTDLEDKGTVERSVIDSLPVKAKKVLYKCEKKRCPICKKIIKGKPVILPKSLYGNQLVSQAAVMHYGHGVPVGRVEAVLGKNVQSGALFDIFHRLGQLWESAVSGIIDEFRQEHVKHADETGWRTDGRTGYAWIFCGEKTSIFQFNDTRSARIPKAVFGNEELSGVLVVDRYQAYNKAPCAIQYCYAHLLRKVEDSGKQFDDDPEVRCFVGTLAPLLSKAIHLRTTSISDTTYYKKSRALKKKIVKVIESPSSHLAIKEIQTIFKENEARLYHWVEDRKVPAENNRAERELRPTVIARKVSFGSQSEQGARTRSTLMTILHTAQKRLKDQTLQEWFKHALDEISLNPDIDPFSLIPPVPS